ncbi:methyl-accepting chemotaxis protein [Neptunomonas japonica]|nr:methyl-accepting chemotaxis protein [Neptunomonas japonica]
MSLFSKMTIKAKLFLGFGLLIAISFLSSLLVFSQLEKTLDKQKLLLDVRYPTVEAGERLSGAISQTLSGLRGYLILGDDPVKAGIFRNERALGWHKLDAALSELNTFSQQWTVPNNITKLNEMQQLIDEFRISQQEIEGIAHTSANIPSFDILLTKAAPRASKTVAALTALIEKEVENTSSYERKQLLKTLADSRASFALGLANIRAYLLSGDEKFQAKFLALWDKNELQFKTLKASSALFAFNQKNQWNEYKKHRAEFRPYVDEMFASRSSSDWNKANAWLGTKAAPKAKRIKEILLEMSQSQKSLLKSDKAKLVSAVDTLELVLLISLLLTVVLGCLLAYTISRSVTKPLGGEPQDMALLADCIANGDLTTDFDNSGKAQGLYLSMINMNTKLQGLVNDIHMLSQALASTSTETASIAEQTNNNVQAQYEQTELVATAVEEMTATVSEVAENAANCALLTEESGEITIKGKGNVQKTIVTIEQLSEEINQASKVIVSVQEKSQSIGSISEVIAGIAEQTNLLALNAAIEAARAGDQGRGFAVVADEVRSLASKTQESIASINSIIETLQNSSNEAVSVMQQSQQKAQDTLEQAHTSGESLNLIANSVQRIQDMVSQIAVASEEQASVTRDISQNVHQISSVAQQTSVGASETVQAGEEMSKQAEALQSLVSTFKV